MNELENNYLKLYQAMIQKDENVLLEILDENFKLYHISGIMQDKVAFISAILDGTLNYYSVEHEKIDVQLKGKEAILDGYSVVEAAVFGGGKNTWRLHLKIKQEHKNDKWLLTEARASVY